MFRIRGMGSIAGCAALIFAFSACAGEEPSPERRAVETKSPQVATGLARFLLQPNEEPGFSPSSEPETISTVEAFVKDIEDAPPAEAQALRENGFKAFVVVPLESDRGDAGVSNVLEFATEDGARRHLAFLMRAVDEQFEGATIQRFEIPEVPTAAGFLAWKPDEFDVANVNWMQGRCLMTLGNGGSGPHAGLPTSFIEPLSTGVKAIFERTGGQCP
jgi:hypothetical protein